MAEFFSPEVVVASLAGAAVTVCLFEGSTQIGRLCASLTAGATPESVALVGRLRFSPSAASHTYTVTAFRAGANGIIEAGAGGTGALVPSYLRFTKV